MIEVMSNRLAVKLKKINPEETASIEVMSYALQGILHNLITIVTALAVGSIFQQFWETFFAAICFTVLRLVSGGYHFKSALACFIVTASVFIAIPFVDVSHSVLLAMNVASLLLAAIYAPSNIKGHVRVEEKYFSVFKVISMGLIAINFIYLTPIITVTFFAQALSLITYPKEVRS